MKTNKPVKKSGFLPKLVLTGVLGGGSFLGTLAGYSRPFSFEAKMIDAEGNRFYATADNVDDAMKYLQKTRAFIESEYKERKIKELESKLAEYENKTKALETGTNQIQQGSKNEYVLQSTRTTVTEVKFSNEGEAAFYERDQREILLGK